MFTCNNGRSGLQYLGESLQFKDLLILRTGREPFISCNPNKITLLTNR